MGARGDDAGDGVSLKRWTFRGVVMSQREIAGVINRSEGWVSAKMGKARPGSGDVAALLVGTFERGTAQHGHICVGCGVAFRSESKDARYHSRECSFAAKKKEETRTCAACGRAFTRTPHRMARGVECCSNECASVSRRRSFVVLGVVMTAHDVAAIAGIPVKRAAQRLRKYREAESVPAHVLRPVYVSGGPAGPRTAQRRTMRHHAVRCRPVT